MRRSAQMFLRPNHRSKDGKEHTCWSLVETVRPADGPWQKTLCYLCEVTKLRTFEVFNKHGDAQQLKLFPPDVEPPPDDQHCRAEPQSALLPRVGCHNTLLQPR